jgi:hypothetical protein
MSVSEELTVLPASLDEQAVVDRTDQWLHCAVSGNVDPMRDILAEDFRYTSNPRFGVEAMTKLQLIEVASLLRDDGTAKLEHRLLRVGNLIVSTTVTRSREVINGDPAAASATTMNATMNGKLLVYVSGWRAEAGTWRCFDMHLLDAL